MFKNILYIISNFILTLYGVIIKSYREIPLLDQVYIRSIIFTIISFIGLKGFSNLHGVFNITYKPITFLLSIVNFISIYGIYISFQYLGIGISQAIMYSWPIFYYLAIQPKYSFSEVIVLIITFFCVLLVTPSTNNGELHKKKLIGLIGIIASVITHIYVFYYMKKHSPDINEYLFSQYIFVTIGLTLYFLYQYVFRNYTILFKKMIPIVLFNLFLGYIAFYLQFYSVDVLNPFILSLLTFLSIIFGVVIDRIVFKQTLEINQIIGIIGIVILNYFFIKT
jgi:drug/metabolite transporter (DMT)-like permease